MSKLIYNNSWYKAQAVLAIMEILASDDNSDDIDIRIHTLATEHGDGLHFVVGYTHKRMANVLGDNKGDGIIVNYGYEHDYEFPSGKARDGVKRIIFSHTQIYEAAECLVEWLEKGIEYHGN